MATDPHGRNDDSDRQLISADGYRIGVARNIIVFAFMMNDVSADIGLTFNREQALDLLGRLSFEIRAKGWLS